VDLGPQIRLFDVRAPRLTREARHRRVVARSYVARVCRPSSAVCSL